MDQVAAMQVLDRFEQLVEDKFSMLLVEDVGSDHRVEVGLYVVENYVDVRVIV